MTTYTASDAATLKNLQLGDIVSLPTIPAISVRALEAQLACIVGTMSGFVLLGEIGPDCYLLSITSDDHGQVDIYTPLDHIPVRYQHAEARCQGVVSYWAPHLPNISGAQGELGYKVARIRGAIDPMVIVWRGNERVVFLRTSTMPYTALQVTELPRNSEQTEKDVSRYASYVTTQTPYQAPAPPQHLPEKAPQKTGQRKRRLALPFLK